MAKYSHVVVGLGVSGFSAMQYLLKQGYTVAATDSRKKPPMLSSVACDAPVFTGGISTELLDAAECIVLSPGVSSLEPAIAAQIVKGKSVINDIELFAKATDIPVIAITGTNAKSSVTTLVGDMAHRAGLSVGVGGNLGTPALDLLSLSRPALFVLELSSFQLEFTSSLCPVVASVLNVTPDHMDRYPDFKAYAATKRKIFHNATIAVFNADDPETFCEDRNTHRLAFTLGASKPGTAGLIMHAGESWLSVQAEPILPVSALPILGRHAVANALAALAIGYAYGFPVPMMQDALKAFRGLPHRCQWVGECNGVRWFNDSKGTNVGATLAAISGLGADCPGKIILIAGGVSKGADFSLLLPVIEKIVKSVVLIGESAPALQLLFKAVVDTHRADSMADAVAMADTLASSGDFVLLSPACASFDMFANFEHRGDVFETCVKRLF